MTDAPASKEREALNHIYAARMEQVARARDRLRGIVQAAAKRRKLTPEAVSAYAALHLTKDDGTPIVPAEHHLLWLRYLCDERVKKLMLIAPPESAKTTWVISAFVGMYVGTYPERSTIIGSVTGPVAEKRSLSLRLMAETPDWQQTFPTVKQAAGLPWTATEWSIATNGIPHSGRLHPTCSAYGTGGSVIGARADLVVADDLHDYENSRTPNQRNLVTEWFHRSLLSRRKSRTGRAVIVGTAWHHDDLYARSRRDGGWLTIHIPLLSDGPEVYATITYPDDWKYERIGEPFGDETLMRGIQSDAARLEEAHHQGVLVG
jgi:hypothetical protein